MANVTLPGAKLLEDPGYLLAAPLGSTLPTNTVVGSVFTDSWPAAWLPLGPTTEGSNFKFSSTVDTIKAAEYFDPLKYKTTARTASIAFALLDFTLQRLQTAWNGGLTALVPVSGSTTTALYEIEPPDPGAEVRLMIGWESTDATMRLILRQTFQGGEVSADFKAGAVAASIPVTFNCEKPASAKLLKWSSTRG